MATMKNLSTMANATFNGTAINATTAAAELARLQTEYNMLRTEMRANFSEER